MQKLPIIALIAGALFDNAWWVGPSAYFVGIAAIICSGIIFEKDQDLRRGTRSVRNGAARIPYAYCIRCTEKYVGERLVVHQESLYRYSSVHHRDLVLPPPMVFVNGAFTAVENLDQSIMAVIGRSFAWVFAPIGFGDWRSAVAAINGLVAKENVVSTFGILFWVCPR